MRLGIEIDARSVRAWRDRAVVRGGAWARAASVGVAVVSVMGALSCASIAVESVVLSPETDFASLETYYIVSVENEHGQSYRAIETAIANELTKLGHRSASPDDADMWVVYRASALDRQKRRLSGDPDAKSYRIVNYVEGTLAIDVFEHSGARRAWHGQAVIDERSRDALRAQADRVVSAIFAEFPES